MGMYRRGYRGVFWDGFGRGMYPGRDRLNG